MSLIDALMQINPINGNASEALPGSINVEVSVFPPGVAIILSVPPFAVILNASAAAELAAVLLELAPLIVP